MAVSPIQRTFTIEEYERLAKIGLLGRTELLNGVIWSMETGRPWTFTVDAVYRMVEAGVLRRDEVPEVLDGVLVVRPIADHQEAAVIDRIARALVIAMVDRAIVRIRGPLQLSGTTGVTPGAVILKTREDWYRDFCPGATDVLLVIEVVLGGMHSGVSERSASIRDQAYPKSGWRTSRPNCSKSRETRMVLAAIASGAIMYALMKSRRARSRRSGFVLAISSSVQAG